MQTLGLWTQHGMHVVCCLDQFFCRIDVKRHPSGGGGGFLARGQPAGHGLGVRGPSDGGGGGTSLPVGGAVQPAVLPCVHVIHFKSAGCRFLLVGTSTLCVDTESGVSCGPVPASHGVFLQQLIMSTAHTAENRGSPKHNLLAVLAATRATCLSACHLCFRRCCRRPASLSSPTAAYSRRQGQLQQQ